MLLPQGPDTGKNQNPAKDRKRPQRNGWRDQARKTVSTGTQRGCEAVTEATGGGGDGEGMHRRGRGRGRGGGAAQMGRGAGSGTGRQGGGATQTGGWRGRGRNGGNGVERERSEIRRSRQQDVFRRDRATQEVSGMGTPKNGGRSNCPRVGTPRGHGLGYKKLEELSGKDPSVVAITLSSHHALQDVLNETTMGKDLVELLCQVLSKAFKSRTERATVQHLAGSVKESGFFRNLLPYYLAGMESECSAERRAKYPQHLENILAIMSQVKKQGNE